MDSRKEHHDEDRALELERERAARAAAEAASRMKDEFLATISHELRTPLTAILLWSRILREGKIGAKDRREAIDAIERSAMSQAELIEDLLDISRMLSGRLRLSVRRIELTPVVRAAVQAAQVMADGKGVLLEVQFDPTCAAVHADPVRIQQVAWNLLTNAIRATPRGGRVTVTLKNHNDKVRLQVIDTGRGIKPDVLRNMFEGVQTGAAAKTQPAVLGLVLARRLVELHGGSIHAESAGEGAGATVTVDLPVKAPDKAVHSGRRVHGKGSSGLAPEMLRGLRVVLVEDETDTRNVIRWVLEQSGAQVQAVDSAAKAMEILKGAAPAADVLVSDIGMAGEDGNDLIRQIRALDARENGAAMIPAIAITAYASDADRVRALKAGYSAFLPKPIEADEMVLLIASLANRGKPTHPAK